MVSASTFQEWTREMNTLNQENVCNHGYQSNRH
jgi:hypothetical protein